jgi:hypothetical protein
MTLRTIALVLFGLFVLFTLRRRLRRDPGRQRSWRPRRMLVSVAVLVAVGSALLLAARHTPHALAAGAGGLAVGAVLGVVGLRLTRFESNPEALFFMSNGYLNAVLVLVVIGRLAYRFAVIGAAGQSSAGPRFQIHPITLFLLTLLIGYAASYMTGLLRTARKLGSGLLVAGAPSGGG